jgi:DNA-binding MarR family transcriptional regulator
MGNGEPFVKNETVVDLIKDLTAKLSAVAEEFNGRVAKAAEPVLPSEEPNEAALVDHANVVLAERRMRRQFLPAELFHEPAWDMLLALFAARDDRMPMNIKALVSMSDAPVTTSQRWIEHLHKLKLIDRVIDPTDRRRVEISLSYAGDQQMKAYLRALLRR